MCGNEVTNRNRIIRNTSILSIVASLQIAGVKVVLTIETEFV